MKLLSLISLRNEPALEKWARYFRFEEAVPGLLKYMNTHAGQIRLIDFGCGQDILFYKFLKFRFPQEISRIQYIGIDPLIKPYEKKGIEIIRSRFESVRLKEKADVALMFAVLEHVDNPGSLLGKALGQLKPGGLILATTPSWLSQPFLEFFSFRLDIISKREIEEHKRYFTRAVLLFLGEQLEKKYKKIKVHHHYFELGLNNFFSVQKS